MRPRCATDLEIAALATAQYGVVARRQLLLLGFSDASIKRRVRSGRLHRLHHGVYAVGHRVLRAEGRWMAAVMASGSDAVLSHATAAAAWDLRPIGSGMVHVTIPRDTGRRRRAGLRVHRIKALGPDETTTNRGIPITTPARTIIDLSASLQGRPLEQALDRADQQRLIDFTDLRSRPVPRSLQAVLSLYTAGATVTRSEMEERFLTLCDHHGIRRPQVNAHVEGIEVDFVWREARLIVEVDGYRYHRSPSSFEADRERDVMLTLAGWQVLRFTWTQLTTRPAWVATAVAKRVSRGA